MVINKKFWSSKRVLLTGHTGFKGSWLMLCLQELGAEVWGYSLEPEPSPNLFRDLETNRPSSSQKSDIFWVNKIGDIRDQKLLENYFEKCQPDVVFHLAAQPLVRKSYKDPIETWSTNVMGSLNVLEACRSIKEKCAVVMITTDKVYENKEWNYGYREIDPLGGYDPYSASKASSEIVISSWRSSFCGELPFQKNNLGIASARSGNVIGGGDWALDRIVPDVMRSLIAKQVIKIRNPLSTRPWQHVLDPISGYLDLAEKLYENKTLFNQAFNFGPYVESNKSVQELVNEIFKSWPGKSHNIKEEIALHEANLLNLQIDKAYHLLNWKPTWNFKDTIIKTTEWYKKNNEGISSLECCLSDINSFFNRDINNSK